MKKEKDNVVRTKKCMRCDTLKQEKEFVKDYKELRSELLNICNTCLKEESNLLGESLKELKGIYIYLQKHYSKYITEETYNRFWEQALYDSKAKPVDYGGNYDIGHSLARN